MNSSTQQEEEDSFISSSSNKENLLPRPVNKTKGSALLKPTVSLSSIAVPTAPLLTTTTTSTCVSSLPFRTLNSSVASTLNPSTLAVGVSKADEKSRQDKLIRELEAANAALSAQLLRDAEIENGNKQALTALKAQMQEREKHMALLASKHQSEMATLRESFEKQIAVATAKAKHDRGMIICQVKESHAKELEKLRLVFESQNNEILQGRKRVEQLREDNAKKDSIILNYEQKLEEIRGIAERKVDQLNAQALARESTIKQMSAEIKSLKELTINCDAVSMPPDFTTMKIEDIVEFQSLKAKYDLAQEELDEFFDTVASLNKQIEIQESEIATLNETVQSLESDLEQKRSLLPNNDDAALQEHEMRWRTAHQVMASEVSVLQAEISSLNAHAAATASKIAEGELYVSSLQESLELARSDIAILTEEAVESVAAHQAAQEASQIEILNLQTTCGDLISQINEISSSQKNAEEAFESRLASECQKLVAEHESQQAALTNSWQDRLSAIEVLNFGYKEHEEELMKELDALLQEKSALSAKLLESESLMTKLYSEIAVLKEAENYGQQSRIPDSDIAELRDQLEVKTRAVADISNSLQDITAERDEFILKIEVTSAQQSAIVAEKEAAVALLESQLLATTDEIHALKASNLAAISELQTKLDAAHSLESERMFKSAGDSSTIRDLEGSVAELESKLEESRKLISSGLNQRCELDLEVEIARQREVAFKAELSLFKQNYDNAIDDISTLTQKYNASEEAIKKLDENIVTESSRHLASQSRVTDLEAQLKEREMEASELEARLKQSLANLKQAQDKNEISLARICNLEMNELVLVKNVEQIQASQSQDLATITAQKSRIESLEDVVQQWQSSYSDAGSKLQSKEAALTELTADIASLRSEHSNLLQSHSKLQGHFDLLNDSHNALELSFNEVTSQRDELLSNLSAERDKSSASAALLQQEQESLQNMKAQLAQVQSNRDALATQCERIEARLSQVNAKMLGIVQEKSSDRSSFQATIQDLEAKNHTLSQEINALKSNLTISDKNCDDLSSQLDALIEKVDELEQSKSTYAQLITDLEEQKMNADAMFKADLARSEAASNEASKLLADMKIDSETLQAKSAESQREYQAELNIAAQTTLDLENELSSKREQYDSLSEELERLRQELDRAEEEAQVSGRLVERLTFQVAQMEEAAQVSVETALGPWRNRVAELEALAEVGKSEIAKHEASVASLNAELAATKELQELLEANISSMEGENKSLSDSLSSAKKCLESQEADLNKAMNELQEFRDSASADLAAEKEKVVEISKELDIKGATISQFEEALLLAQSYMNSKDADLAALQDKCSKYESSVAEMQRNADFLTANLTDQSVLLKELEARAHRNPLVDVDVQVILPVSEGSVQTEMDMATFLLERESMLSNHASLSGNLESVASELCAVKERLDATERLVASLKLEISTLQSSYEVEKEMLSSSLKEKTAECETLLEDFTKLVSALKDSETEQVTLKQALSDKAARIIELQATVKELELACGALRDAMAKDTSNLDSMKVLNEELDEKYLKALKDVRRLESANETLSRKLARSQKDVSTSSSSASSSLATLTSLKRTSDSSDTFLKLSRQSASRNALSVSKGKAVEVPDKKVEPKMSLKDSELSVSSVPNAQSIPSPVAAVMTASRVLAPSNTGPETKESILPPNNALSASAVPSQEVNSATMPVITPIKKKLQSQEDKPSPCRQQ